MSGPIQDLPVRVCQQCGALWVEDDQMYEDPARCPRCGCYPLPLGDAPGDDDFAWY